jgi:hypothetical protein
LPFFLWTLKVFCCFGILKFWSFQFSFGHLEVPYGGKKCWGNCLKIWGFSTLFWWRSRTLGFVLVNFKCSQKL